MTKDFVCGLEAVLPSGEIIHCGGKLVKNVTGYNLVQLLVGSEGTLAVVTKIILRLLPLPKVQIDLLVPFDDFEAAAATVSAIIAHSIVPATIEFMERDSVLAVEKLLGKEVPYHDAAAHLLIQLDGSHQDAVDADFEIVGELCLDNGARDVLVARDRHTRDRLWETRRMIIESLNHESPVSHMEDVVVPRAALPALLKGIKHSPPNTTCASSALATPAVSLMLLDSTWLFPRKTASCTIANWVMICQKQSYRGLEKPQHRRSHRTMPLCSMFIVTAMRALGIVDIAGNTWPQEVGAWRRFLITQPVWHPSGEFVAWVEWRIHLTCPGTERVCA